MKKYIAKFHYLTQDHPSRSHVEQTRLACEAGAKWIQYRCLSKSTPELIKDLHPIAELCDDWGVTLILTNHYQLLDRIDAQGVHIEDMHADWGKIRSIIGGNKTLGASANSFTDILRIAASATVDYIGCGPFAVTHTKPNDYPLLGVKGYSEIVKKMQDSALDIPLIAVGGIEVHDIDTLLETKIHGIAVSAAVNLVDNPSTALKEIYKKIY